MKPVATEHLLDLAALLKERVGLHVRREGHSALRIAVAARLEGLAAVADSGAYLALLRSGAGDEELRRLLPLVTVGKTSFFRDERQFRALDAILPGLLDRARSGGRRVGIWSAGCATGEEPYSIAMAAAEAGASPDDVEILATDVNPEAVAFAARGAYEPRRVREIPAHFLGRHFDRDGDAFHVRAGLRRYLRAIRPHNLVSSAFPRPAEGGWDVVFCRNVIIYFDTPTTQAVLAQFHEALAPGGYLFLGYSESLFRLFDGFELTEVSGAFLYRRPEAPTRAGPSAPLAPPSRPHLVQMPAAPPPVRHLSLAPPPTARPTAPARDPEPLPLAPQEYLDAAVALFADGRFGAARELLERLLEKGGDDLAARLTLANLYGVLRQPDRARASYEAALALEPLSAEAHLFYGIHLLSGGDAEAAALELARALFLDPDLALGHYYLGRCREAQRDVVRARLAYRNALEAYRRRPDGRAQAFLGYYPDIPEDGSAFARAAEYALAAL
ncbi:CheR family methyltransferase [Anaeromyxobacter dehalogenans]|uniref:MCP methyltransferase, CheR-type n=1 Tax=Anaeromyxobacter dehalogenans (strain 2CP-C) TaxID=290397 RepID=Q2INL0_ANADE|nr:CheR family methyltransferase [Anaeromyxobacter dehalogenans]ABC80391.1 MCP methyltransferase, CheR-type [Anaeromyxobacter dehalogenans 2CP-C]